MAEKCCAKPKQRGASIADFEMQDGSVRGLTQAGYVSEYHVSRMDCPSEEGLIRTALSEPSLSLALEFDLPNRKVYVFHSGGSEAITERLSALGLGATHLGTRPVAAEQLTALRSRAREVAERESGILKILLLINAVMFAVEFAAGWWAESTGLLADSLDMFADAAVYGVALYAVGHSAAAKVKAAHFSGWLQLILALVALTEVARRYIFGSEPASVLMIGFGLVALVANTVCLVLIARSRDSGAHMKASWIFSANDVIANMGVVLAGLLVAWTGSRYPDLVIGLIVGMIVLNGARRILQIRV